MLRHRGTEAACAEAVRRARWPDGFVCPRCKGSAHCVIVSGSRRLFQCHACHRQTSLTAGTLFGIPDAEFGEALAAAVQLHEHAQVDADKVREFLKPRLADYKVPKVVAFHAQMPREDTGKIFKRKLREPYWAGLARRI